MDKNGLQRKGTMVTVVAAAIILFGGFALPSVYVGTVHFSTDFETTGEPHA